MIWQIEMFILTFLGFWFLRKLVVGHATYTLDTDWLVRIPGKLCLRFCQGPLLALGTFLDGQISKIVESFIVIIRNPNLENRMTPMAIGFGGADGTPALFYFYSFENLNHTGIHP
jgi:hypothetical protein